MEITLDKLYDFYKDSLNNCGVFLLNESEDEVGYRIFEEFIIGIISFLHPDSLNRLYLAGFITADIMDKSLKLRNKVLLIDGTDKWNVKAVKTSDKWREIMELTDEIKNEIR